MRSHLSDDIAQLSRTIDTIAGSRPTTQVNRVLFGAFEHLYAEARLAGVPSLAAAAAWSASNRPTYEQLAPVAATLARQPALSAASGG